MASNPNKDVAPSEEETGGSAPKASPRRAASSSPETGIPPNPYAFSVISRILKDPSIKELAHNLAKDPAFSQMSDSSHKTYEGASGEDGFYSQQLESSMQRCRQNPQSMTMARRLANAIMQDPSMSAMLECFKNPRKNPQLEERMARINEDPSSKPLLEEIRTGGPTGLMRFWNDKDVLEKLGDAMGFAVGIGSDAATSADNSGLDDSEEAGNKDESIVHHTASVGDGEVKRARILLEAGADVDARKDCNPSKRGRQDSY